MKAEREDKALKAAIKDLPVLEPGGDLWHKIENQLDDSNQDRFSRPRRTWAALLSLPLIIGGVLWLSVSQKNDSDLTYSQETLRAWPVEFVTGEDEAFNLFLEEECGPEKEVCEEPEFKSLMAELEEVNKEVTTILAVIDESGNDEFLLKARHRLEKEEVRLKKKIVKLLRG